MIFQPHASLQTLNTLGVNAQAALLYTLTDIAALPALLSDARVQQRPRLVLGGGSNIVFTRDFPGVVLKVALRGIRIVAEHDDHVCVEAAAGEPWHAFVQYTLARGWFGLENLSLIPGTVGAAPIQNIGAYGVEIKSVIEQVSAVRFDNGHMLELNAYGNFAVMRLAELIKEKLDISLSMPMPAGAQADAKEMALSDMLPYTAGFYGSCILGPL